MTEKHILIIRDRTSIYYTPLVSTNTSVFATNIYLRNLI